MFWEEIKYVFQILFHQQVLSSILHNTASIKKKPGLKKKTQTTTFMVFWNEK